MYSCWAQNVTLTHRYTFIYRNSGVIYT
uniref:Uncharacterized protein n=1 Tax=Arundo donax TaxID=35708 RepID=A0A0A8Z6G2_ARUDO